jgi:poly-gamma-glutamate synthesis protein (capsule biosynthesis protein)
MKAAGAEASILFIHWGNEYQIQENEIQREMAQAICNLGIDVIIGGHPHVVQPVALLQSSVDETHSTVCLYSMGNAVSNQRIEQIPSAKGYTEDGVLFQVTFARYSDGTVLLEKAELLPTWVNLTRSEETGKTAYEIIPLDSAVEDWKTAFTLTDSELSKAEASYQRTMSIVGEGLDQVQLYLDSQPTPAET